MYTLSTHEYLNLKECATRFHLGFEPFTHVVGVGGVCPSLKFANLSDFARFIAAVQRSYRILAELLVEADTFSFELDGYTIAFWPDIELEQEDTDE